ncbi:hypothetical protein VOM14_20830 [Paraburkholderia sp. MPAMCS5]|uniref:hypothetical protein n=1 Tax=Paraburkholderia sp. MPAMCS5 TaxID=3112563 RepID=UPI002E1965DB|nr:hypothetical protein [Paraburkholderia sp. MPAMCS5]
MKIHQIILNLVVVGSVAAYLPHSQLSIAATTARSAQSGACLGANCSRAASDESETPGAIAEREGARMADDIRKNGSDEDQWKSFILYSDSTDPKDLSLILVRSAGFSMRLEPKSGLLHFQRRGLRQVFAISAPVRKSDIWAKQDVCPQYGIQVLSASPTDAVIVKYCQPFTDSKGKNFTSEEYYLYDIKTATMLTLWSSSTGDKSIPGPFVKPWPAIKKILNGYDLDWKFHDATNPSLKEIVMRNKYSFVFDNKTKTFYLKCKDLTSVGIDEGDMCDGPANLKLMFNNRK